MEVRGLGKRLSGANQQLGSSQMQPAAASAVIGEIPQMRQSNGFGGTSSGLGKMRMSGQGFRPSSRERIGGALPESGGFFGSSEEQSLYSLNMLPLGQDEFTFGSAIKADLLQLQEEITELDSDNKLRSAGNIDFGKGYQTCLKKWLVANSDANIKQIFDRRMKAELDAGKISEVLGHKGNPTEALKKLYRLCLIADTMSSKLTEFEMLTLMRFDDTYSNIVRDDEATNNGNSSGSLSKLKQLAGAGAYQFTKYPVCFANLERFAQLLRVSKRLASRQTGEFMSGNDAGKILLLEKDMKELGETIKKREAKIRELNEKIVDITAKCEAYADEVQTLKSSAISSNVAAASPSLKIVQKVLGKVPDSYKDTPEYWVGLIDETKAFYEGRMREYETENANLKDKLEDQKIKVETLQDQVLDLSEKTNTLTRDKDTIFQNFSKRYPSKEEAVNSYEDALKEEFYRMKKAFEKRIDTLAWDNERVKKEKARALVDMKQKMDKEIETKNLLLKKLSCYIK